MLIYVVYAAVVVSVVVVASLSGTGTLAPMPTVSPTSFPTTTAPTTAAPTTASPTP